MQNLIIKRQTGLVLDGNKISGNTFAVKDYIKKFCGGKWDANSKSWIVDVAKVHDLIAKQLIAIDDSPAKTQSANGTARRNGWCNKCHSYCWGDCTAND